MVSTTDTAFPCATAAGLPTAGAFAYGAAVRERHCFFPALPLLFCRRLMPLRAVLQMATARAVYAAGGKRPAIPYESSNFFTVLSAFVAAHNGRIARVSFRLVRLLRGLRRDGGPVDPVQRRDVPRVRADHLDVARPAGWMSKTASKGRVLGKVLDTPDGLQMSGGSFHCGLMCGRICYSSLYRRRNEKLNDIIVFTRGQSNAIAT